MGSAWDVEWVVGISAAERTSRDEMCNSFAVGRRDARIPNGKRETHARHVVPLDHRKPVPTCKSVPRASTLKEKPFAVRMHEVVRVVALRGTYGCHLAAFFFLLPPSRAALFQGSIRWIIGQVLTLPLRDTYRLFYLSTMARRPIPSHLRLSILHART